MPQPPLLAVMQGGDYAPLRLMPISSTAARFPVEIRISEFGGLKETVKIFIQFDGDGITDRRIPVFVLSSFKDASKFFK